jgi:hypothetical protein
MSDPDERQTLVLAKQQRRKHRTPAREPSVDLAVVDDVDDARPNASGLASLEPPRAPETALPS